MAATRSGLSLLLIVGTAVACDGDGAGPSADDIVGSWTATKVEYVSVSQPVRTIDLIAEGGTGTLEFSAAGTYLFTVEPIDTPGQVDTGAWELDGDILTMWPRGTGLPMRFDAVLSGNRLTLSGGDAEFDFDGDHEADDAKLYLGLVR